jgi:AcrR family transcriptional regulator
MARRAKPIGAARGIAMETDRAILEAAAELMVESGTKEIDVSELAKRAKVNRPTLYARYARGKKVSIGTVIYLRILNEFLKSAGSSIKAGIAVIDQTSHAAPTRGQELSAILRATLSAFKSNEVFGRVVLQELNLRNPAENDLIRPIFDEVDKIIKKAREEGQLDQGPKDDWKVRQILFVLTRGLLRTVYLDQYNKADDLVEPTKMTEKEVEIEILRVLSLYSHQQSEVNVKETMKVLKKREDTP